MHRGFVPRTYALDLVWESGARFVGHIRALTREEAEDRASARMGETVYTLVRSSTRPLPLNDHSEFSDTLPVLAASSALAEMANALRRSEAMADDLPGDPPAPTATQPRRTHTASHLMNEMRVPLRRRDLVLATLAVALSAAAIVLWSMPATPWAS
jgi:hypothetical protein